MFTKEDAIDTRELNRLAVNFTDSILTHDLTKAELIMLVALLEARVMTTIQAPQTPKIETASATTTEEIEDRPAPPHKPKSIQYDPMYDPPPPMTPDPLPARNETPGRVLAKKSTACVCDACKRVVYITNKDVVDGMKVKDFIDAFTPTEGAEPLNRTAEIENMDGNIATDCPLCKSHKKLYLTGGPCV